MDAVRSSDSSSGARRRSNPGIGIVTAADSRERSLGQLHVYDGEGKGKSQGKKSASDNGKGSKKFDTPQDHTKGTGKTGRGGKAVSAGKGRGAVTG